MSPPPLRTVLEHALWENVAYLVDDDKRAVAFAALRKATKLRAEPLLAADRAELVSICAQAGPHALQRAGRLQECARIVLDEFGGDDASVLALPIAAARKQLGKFPAIGKPGADKILLFLGRAPLLALESNGLRTLLRLGYGEENANYDASYRKARDAAAGELAEDCAVRQRAFLLLRELGRRTCKRTHPLCAECPVRADCPSREA